MKPPTHSTTAYSEDRPSFFSHSTTEKRLLMKFVVSDIHAVSPNSEMYFCFHFKTLWKFQKKLKETRCSRRNSKDIMSQRASVEKEHGDTSFQLSLNFIFHYTNIKEFMDFFYSQILTKQNIKIIT